MEVGATFTSAQLQLTIGCRDGKASASMIVAGAQQAQSVSLIFRQTSGQVNLEGWPRATVGTRFNAMAPDGIVLWVTHHAGEPFDLVIDKDHRQTVVMPDAGKAMGQVIQACASLATAALPPPPMFVVARPKAP
jgi:hypothetical protein